MCLLIFIYHNIEVSHCTLNIPSLNGVDVPLYNTLLQQKTYHTIPFQYTIHTITLFPFPLFTFDLQLSNLLTIQYVLKRCKFQYVLNKTLEN